MAKKRRTAVRKLTELGHIATGNMTKNTLIQYPSGKWGFVGRVHEDLSYTMKDGSPLTAAARAAIHQAGPGFAPVKSLAWETPEEATAYAHSIGQEVTLPGPAPRLPETPFFAARPSLPPGTTRG
jgi:hypothetical protein